MKTPPQTAALRRRAEKAIAARRERRAARPRRFAGVRRYLGIIGPGLIVANAGNDAGGIFTYSNTGSKYGLNLLWTFLPILLALIVTQEMVARLGSVTGKGLMDLIRERFGVRWTLFASLVVIVANGGTVLAEFAGIGGALGLLGVPLPVAVLGAALMLGILVLRANRRLVERVFLAMGLTFISYIVTTFMVHPVWGDVAHSLIPTLSHHPGAPDATSYTTDLITLVGTSITPYMQLFLQSSIVDKGTSEKELNYARADVISGSTFAMAVAACIVITTAYTLFAHGFAGHDLSSASDAASALKPLAGEHATQLFAIGLLGASLLAAAVLPLSTAFVVCEAFGAERSVQNRFSEAPLFFGLFIGLLVVGAVTVAVLGSSSIAAVAIGTQTLDGILLPVLLIFILILANDRRLLGRYRNGPFNNAVAVTFVAALSALTGYLVLSTLIPL
ncbi:MAG TPA: Nramp family divalent metal transporter [Candidatus Dormibacteraeota bacterium]|nr:Nramp family divalent metal transporter [Candidatus Dormibacteraeota bacterium]